MLLYIDKDSNQFVSDPLHKVPVDSVGFKRGDAANIELRFIQGGSGVPLASGASIAFGIKPSGAYDGDFLVFADEYTSIGDSAYLIAPSFNTAALDDELNKDGNDANDVASLSAMLEISWSEDAGTTWQSTDTIVAAIANDVIRLDEGTPLELDGPEDWLAANGIVYDPAMTALTGGSNALDGVPTVDADAGRLQAVKQAEKVGLYRLETGTASEFSPITIRPDDYAASTNEKYWRLADWEINTLRSLENVITAFLFVKSVDDSAIVSSDFLTTDRYFQFPDADGTLAVGDSYASDAAAATGGLSVGDLYFNTTSNRFRIRTV